MATSTSNRRTDYGFLWVVAAAALVAFTLGGAWVWLYRKTREVAPKAVWAIWTLLGITVLPVGLSLWGASTAGRGFLRELARTAVQTWFYWLPDLICLYAGATVAVLLLDRNIREQIHRQLQTTVLRLWIGLWIAVTTTVLMGSWTAIFGWGIRPGLAGLMVAPALSLDPNWVGFKSWDMEEISVLLLAALTAVAAVRLRNRARSSWRLALASMFLASVASAVDAWLFRPVEVVGVLLFGFMTLELWRRKAWFYR